MKDGYRLDPPERVGGFPDRSSVDPPWRTEEELNLHAVIAMAKSTQNIEEASEFIQISSPDTV